MANTTTTMLSSGTRKTVSADGNVTVYDPGLRRGDKLIVRVETVPSVNHELSIDELKAKLALLQARLAVREQRRENVAERVAHVDAVATRVFDWYQPMATTVKGKSVPKDRSDRMVVYA